MSDEPFSAEYFQHLLTSLTLNSRALIVELTGLAEKHIDHAATMVRLIEDRIARILPKYKLFSFYLMDLIVKNIGNPYNLLFAANLYRNFTETYLIVTDTATRQNLINLFKTWMTGKTSAGLDLFPHEVLAKVEQFIIKATSLNGSADAAVRISRDTLLREANYLLQYVIALDDGIDKLAESHPLSPQQKDEVNRGRLVRNQLVFEINIISEAVMVAKPADFDAKKDAYAAQLQKIRRTLDDQSFQQRDMVQSVAQRSPAPTLSLTPKHVDVVMILGKDDAFDAYISGWGKIVVKETPRAEPQEPQTPDRRPESPSENADSLDNPDMANVASDSLASSFGLNMASFGFSDSLLGSPTNEIRHVAPASSASDDLMDEYEYDPEEALADMDGRHSPPSSAGLVFAGKSSLKRPNDSEEKVVKRVRFDV